jgi:uncharacterized membrane protein YphA (DoxX/SURF4 family)
MTSRTFVRIAAAMVFVLCVIAFLRGHWDNEWTFQPQRALDNPFGWYFLAKGIFCSVSLVLTQELLSVLRDRSKSN